MDEYNKFINQGQGIKLKSLRKELNITQKALAKGLNVHAKTVAAWEKEKRVMSKNMYIRIFKDRDF